MSCWPSLSLFALGSRRTCLSNLTRMARFTRFSAGPNRTRLSGFPRITLHVPLDGGFPPAALLRGFDDSDKPPTTLACINDLRIIICRYITHAYKYKQQGKHNCQACSTSTESNRTHLFHGSLQLISGPVTLRIDINESFCKMILDKKSAISNRSVSKRIAF